MSSTDDMMSGFYNNDYTDKETPNGYEEMIVQAFEMRSEIEKLNNSKHKIKTGHKGTGLNKIYLLYFKK